MFPLYAVVAVAEAKDATVAGWVLDGITPTSGAAVVAEANNTRIESISGLDGAFKMKVPAGTWTLSASLPDGRVVRYQLVTEEDLATDAVLVFPAPKKPAPAPVPVAPAETPTEAPPVLAAPAEPAPAAPGVPAVETAVASAPEAPPPPPEAPPAPPASRRVTLSGVVLDTEGLGVPRAYIVALGGGTTSTDMDGNYSLEVDTGDVALIVLKGAFDPNEQRVAVSDSMSLNVTLALRQADNEITIRAAERPAGGTVAMLEERREAAEVVDVVGTEQMTKAGDTDAAAALKRVNGLTVIGGKYVYVRGLGDRYSQTLLNGSSLPSPEPEKRVVPLDLFPTSLLESVVIQKTFSPDMPAEFGGGVVSIRTRSVPDEPVLSLGISGAWAGGTTLQDANVAASGATDWLGYGVESRALPTSIATASAEEPLKLAGMFSDGGYTADELESYGEDLTNRWGTESRVLPPDFGLNLSVGRKFDLGGVRLGGLAGLVYSNAWSLDEGWQAVFATGDAGLEEKRHTTYVEAKNKVRLGGMASVGLEWAEEGHVTSTTLLARNSASTAVEYDADDPTGSNDSRNTLLMWEEQQLFFEQIAVGVPIGPLQIDGRYALSLASHDEPDRREYNYTATDSGYVLSQRGSWNDIYYTTLRDTGHDGGLDLTWTLPGELDRSVALGGKVFTRSRTSGVRRFNYEFVGSDGIDLSQPLEDIIVAENIGAEAEGDLGYLQIEENTTSSDDYDAAQTVWAGYLMGDLAWTARFRSSLGARVEASEQVVNTYELFATEGTPPVSADLGTIDVLPALTLSYGIGPAALPDQMVIRAGYGRTVSRPELRELSEVPYYDYRSGRLWFGNPALERATIDSVDLRWEWYPTAGESLSAGGFFKYFQDPIESVVAVSAVSGSVGTFANATSATNVGGEIDLRKRLDFIHRSLLDFYLSGNVSIIASQVDLTGAEGNQTSSERPLQGQSPWVANVQLSYENPDSRTNVAVLWNAFGPRIVEVGTSGIPDTYELPVHRLDLVVTQGIGPHVQLRAKATNVLDQPSRERTGDQISAETRDGWTAGLGVTVTP